MSVLGKIFVYEQNPATLHQYAADLEAQGFFTFGTDNIYQLLKYAQTVNPDVIIMNIPQNFNADNSFWQEFHNSLCTHHCPQIFINAASPFATDSFHYVLFPDTDLSRQEIINLITAAKERHLLN